MQFIKIKTRKRIKRNYSENHCEMLKNSAAIIIKHFKIYFCDSPKNSCTWLIINLSNKTLFWRINIFSVWYHYNTSIAFAFQGWILFKLLDKVNGNEKENGKNGSSRKTNFIRKKWNWKGFFTNELHKQEKTTSKHNIHLKSCLQFMLCWK